MFVDSAVRMDMRRTALMLVNMNGGQPVIIVSETMGGTRRIAEGKSGGRSQYAKQIDRGQHDG